MPYLNIRANGTVKQAWGYTSKAEASLDGSNICLAFRYNGTVYYLATAKYVDEEVTPTNENCVTKFRRGDYIYTVRKNNSTSLHQVFQLSLEGDYTYSFDAGTFALGGTINAFSWDGWRGDDAVSTGSSVTSYEVGKGGRGGGGMVVALGEVHGLQDNIIYLGGGGGGGGGGVYRSGPYTKVVYSGGSGGKGSAVNLEFYPITRASNFIFYNDYDTDGGYGKSGSSGGYREYNGSSGYAGGRGGDGSYIGYGGSYADSVTSHNGSNGGKGGRIVGSRPKIVKNWTDIDSYYNQFIAIYAKRLP